MTDNETAAVDDREMLLRQIHALQTIIASNRVALDLYAHRPWRFVPGDKVLVLAGDKIIGGVVQQIRIPGPVREDHIIQIKLDLTDNESVMELGWWHPDHVEVVA